MSESLNYPIAEHRPKPQSLSDVLLDELSMYPSAKELSLSIRGLAKLYGPAPITKQLQYNARLLHRSDSVRHAERPGGMATDYYAGSMYALHCFHTVLPRKEQMNVLFNFGKGVGPKDTEPLKEINYDDEILSQLLAVQNEDLNTCISITTETLYGHHSNGQSKGNEFTFGFVHTSDTIRAGLEETASLNRTK